MLALPEQIEQLSSALNAEQVSHFLGVSDKTVYQWAKHGRLPSYAIGTSIRFDPKTIADWLRGKAR